jgi:hypothetical protein
MLKGARHFRIADIIEVQVAQTILEVGKYVDFTREIPPEQRQTASRISGLVSGSELPAVEEPTACLRAMRSATWPVTTLGWTSP